MDFDSSALPYDDSVLRDKKVWFCPNTECSFQSKLRQGKRCPKCGREAREFDLFGMRELLQLKKMRIQERSKLSDLGPKRVQYERYGLIGGVLLLVAFLLLAFWTIDAFWFMKLAIMFTCLILGLILLAVQFGRVE